MAVPQPPKQKIKPGIAGIIIGIVLIIAGVGGCSAAIIVPVLAVTSQVTDLVNSASGKNRIEAGQSQTFELKDVENVWIFGVASS